MRAQQSLRTFGALAVLIATVCGTSAVAGTVAFTRARIIDGTGKAAVQNATILVRDGRIVARFVDPDYRKRMAIDELIAALK